MSEADDELAPAYVVLKAGYDLGVEEERERILEILRSKAATRTVLQKLIRPLYFKEMEKAIMEAQDD